MNPSSNGLLRTYQADLSASIQRLDTLEKEHQRLKKKIRSKKRRKSLNSYDEDSEEDDSWKLLKENANVHGLKDLFFTSSSKLKVTWILLLILAAILTVHGCYTIIVEYLVGRVVVSYFVYEASDLPLPDLVICPLNRFNRTFLENLNVSAGLAQYMELSFPLYPMHPFQQPTFDAVMGNTDFYNNELELLLTRLGNMTYRDFLNKASLPCEAFMDNPDDCANSTEIYCSAGKCFRIPGDTQYSAGFATGDHRIINLPTESYSPAANQIPNDGIIVKLVEKGMGIDNDFTFVPTGVHAIFPITAVKYEFMNDPPKYMCQEESNYTYSSVYCFEECFVEEAEAVCNCSLAGATTPRKAITCTAQQYFNCFFPQLSALGFDKNKKCRSQCPPPCTYWEYEKHVSFANFPSKSARYFVKDEKEWQKLQSTIIIEIYYKDLKYTSIKHVIAMPLQSLIAQIGGQFSLWAGGSLISLLQLVIYLSRHFYHRCHRAVRHQRRKSLAAAAARRASTRRSSSIPRSSKVLNGNSLTHHLIRIEPDSLEKVPV